MSDLKATENSDIVEEVTLEEVSEVIKNENKDVVVWSGHSFVHALSGATGSVISMSTFYPLDTIRTRLQVDDQRKAKPTWKVIQELCNEEGVTTLYRGLLPVLSSLYCSNFVYFYTFHGLKKLLIVRSLKPSPTTDLLLGYFAGIINSLITTPLWVANTRLKLQGIKMKQNGDEKNKKKYTGLIDAVQKIAKEEGIPALWSGIRTSFILSGNPAIQFMVYEGIKRFVTRIKRIDANNIKAISDLEYFVMGGAAKAVATLFTYPLQLAQCRLRAGRNKDANSKQGMLQMLIRIYRERGLLGLFKGLEAKMMQTVLTASLMFLIYEKLLKFISRLLGVKLLPIK